MNDLKGAIAHLLKAGACAGLFLYSQEAHAAYVNRVTATYMYRATPSLVAGTHTVRTTNLTAGCDTYLHILNASTGVEIAHDDDAGGGTSSLVSFTLPAAASVVILVRSFVPTTTGRADVQIDGALFASSVRVGGTLVNGLPVGNLRYETAITDGSTDTYIYGLDTLGRVILSDDDGGVGYASRMTSTSIRSVIVGAYSESNEGATILYANDYTSDPDGDGLGSALEAELATCPTATCPGIFNGADTDRDGLSDSAEVFGVDDPAAAFPQYLARWGATPTHKDVFLEIDWDPSLTAQPVTAADIDWLQSNWYIAGSAADLKNPDTAPGIRIHADIGPNAAAPPQTRSGNWGGASRTNTADYDAAADDPFNFAVIRRGIFHHTQIASTYYGQSAGVPSWKLGWGGSMNGTVFSTNMFTLAHELGHNLGLDHHGVDSWGVANCKPTYVSVMNYSWGGNTPFSQGQNANIVLNPSRLSELNTFSASLPEPTYMDHALNARSGRLFDWNLDGTFIDGSTGFFGSVRGTANWSWVDGCSAFEYGSQDLQAGAGIIAQDTPKLARIGTRLYMFTITPAGALQYRRGTVSGADGNGSCPLGTPACMTWGAPTNSSIASTVTSVSAVPWQGGILVAYRRSGSLYASFATANASGVLTFSAPTTIAALNTLPELAIMNVNPSVFGVSEVAAVFAQSAGKYKMFTAGSPTGTWTARPDVTRSDGVVLTGSLVPTVVAWPNRGGVDHSSIAKSCGTFNDTSNNARFYCYDKATNRWTDLSSSMYAGGAIEQTTVKTSLAYHVTRDDIGVPLENDVTRGHFWQVTIPTTDARPRLRVSSKVSSTNPPAVGAMAFGNSGLYWNPWDSYLPFTNVGLYEDESMSALKGASILNRADSGGGPILQFLPFADGTESATFTDGNDFQVMERGICRSIHPSDELTWCGPANQWGY